MNECQWCETLVGLCERVCWQSDLAWRRSLGWDSFWWSPSGTVDWIYWNTGCRFGVVLWCFLRRPWNPLRCNHITIHIRRGEDLLLQPTGDRVFFFIGTCGHQRRAGQSESHILGTKVSFHTWKAMGRKKSKFNYWDSISKHIQTHKLNPAAHTLVDTNTCTYNRRHKHAHIHKMKGNEMAANPSTQTEINFQLGTCAEERH